jgi:hypothetical protein
MFRRLLVCYTAFGVGTFFGICIFEQNFPKDLVQWQNAVGIVAYWPALWLLLVVG